MLKADAEAALSKMDDVDTGDSIDIDKLKSEFEAKQKELFKNDKEFISEIQKAEASKRNEMWLSKLKKRSGITAEEIKDKSIDEVVEMAFEKLRKKGDATSEELQQQLVAATAEVKKLREEELPNTLKQVDAHKKQITIESKFEKMVSSLPKKLRVGAIAAIATAKEKLGSNYIIDLDDKGEIIILTKEGLKPKSTDGTKILSASELITDILDGEKLLENSGSGGGEDDPTKKKITIRGNENKDDLYNRFPHLKKAEDHAAKVKADLESNKN